MELSNKTKKELLDDIEEIQHRLDEANETIEAIRTGKVDALVVRGNGGHQLYTLKSADQTYRVFIEKMTEGAVTLNRQGMIVYSNSSFANLVNVPLSNVMGASFKEFVSVDSREEYEKLFQHGWQQDSKGELQIRSGDKEKPVLVSLTALELDGGLSMSIILTDLTSQKRTQQQLSLFNQQLQDSNHALEDSNHDLQQFASVASHDLQEPLRKIQIFSNLLRDNYGNSFPEESQRWLNKIIDSAGRMKTLIIDILNYSRLSSHISQFDEIDLNLLVKDVLDDFDLIVLEKKANINVGKLPVVTVNKGQIRQVFQNIISNALKFVQAGQLPEIHISAKRIAEKDFSGREMPDGPFCLISIKDNGIGFNEQYADNIFALFERLHSKDQYEGTGIGLSIARKIIEKHDGLIDVKSKEGEGSEFMIILPMMHQP
jgi:PAS domain S-box-containing protein